MISDYSKFSQNFQVRYGEVNQFGYLMIHHIFNYLQEIAFNHADMIANSVEGKNIFDFAVVWTRMKLNLKKIPIWKENLTVSTWISPLEEPMRYAFRNFSISNHSNQIIGNGYGSLIFFDLKQRKAIDIPEEVKNYPTHKEEGDTHQFSTINLELNDKNSPSFQVKFQDLDIYHHVNNVKYIEWAFQVVKSEVYDLFYPFSVEINFLKELRVGEFICVQTEYLEEVSELKINHLIFKEKTKEKIAQLQTLWKRK